VSDISAPNDEMDREIKSLFDADPQIYCILSDTSLHSVLKAKDARNYGQDIDVLSTKKIELTNLLNLKIDTQQSALYSILIVSTTNSNELSLAVNIDSTTHNLKWTN
jgi:hypothetical protein